MKKILSVLCALAFIASFACIGASAADTVATFSLVAANPEVGATEMTVDLVANLPEGSDVTQLSVYVDYDEALTLAKCEKKYNSGMFQTSQTVEVKPYKILWIEGTGTLPAGDSVIATLTFTLPADAALDTAYEFKLSLDEENMPASTTGVEYTADQIGVNGTTATVVEPVPVVTTTEAPVTTEEVTTVATTEEVTTVATTEATEAPATETETESTKAPDKSTQTGDMMFVVVAVMVVALGAAVVVKKVNVK